MKVGILLSGRFPTEKAYGVATNGTADALSELGHEVTVFGLKPNYIEEYNEVKKFKVIEYSENFISKLLKSIAFKNYGFINLLAWKAYWILLTFLNKKLISQLGFDLLWIRDLHMMRFSSVSQNIVFEVHQKIEVSSLNQMTNTQQSKNILVAPISKFLYEGLVAVSNNLNTVYSPMGVRPETITSINLTSTFISNLKIKANSSTPNFEVGYVGKFFPDGNSKGVEDIIALAQVNKSLDGNLHISLTGGTKEEVFKIKKFMEVKQISLADLEINTHMAHKNALGKMRELDVIILPAPSSPNYHGFPLKCIEAVASGRLVVAAKSRIYMDIFTEEYQPYWYESRSGESLYSCIGEALIDNDLEERINSGLKFAKQFTWESRTKRIISNLFKDVV